MARKSPRRANRSLKEAWGPRNPGLTKSHRVFVMLDDRVQRHLLWNVFFPSNEIQRNAHVNFWIKSSISSSNPPVVCLPFVFFVGANSVIVVNGHTKNWISWFMAVLVSPKKPVSPAFSLQWRLKCDKSRVTLVFPEIVLKESVGALGSRVQWSNSREEAGLECFILSCLLWENSDLASSVQNRSRFRWEKGLKDVKCWKSSGLCRQLKIHLSFSLQDWCGPASLAPRTTLPRYWKQFNTPWAGGYTTLQPQLFTYYLSPIECTMSPSMSSYPNHQDLDVLRCW